MPNATAIKFGYPQTLIAEHGPWLVLLRPKAPTLGALTIVHRSDARAFGSLPAEDYTALQPVVARVERVLQQRVAFDRINHVMLMMVDPDVHFHVLPRYAEPREFHGSRFVDAGWPGPPALDQVITLDAAQRDALTSELRALWQAAE